MKNRKDEALAVRGYGFGNDGSAVAGKEMK